MAEDDLRHAREHYRGAIKELKEREWTLANALVDQIQEHLHQEEAGLRLTAMLVKEIPDQPSLDHSNLKREAIKQLEETQRALNALKQKVQALRGVEQ
jgi:hypothetical protein